jgi:hypothetical protein
LKGSHIQHWAELRSQGQRVLDFCKNKSGNVWLSEYNLLKPSKFIDAFGTRTVLARTDRKIEINCRRCGAQAETLGNIVRL